MEKLSLVWWYISSRGIISMDASSYCIIFRVSKNGLADNLTVRQNQQTSSLPFSVHLSLRPCTTLWWPLSSLLPLFFLNFISCQRLCLLRKILFPQCLLAPSLWSSDFKLVSTLFLFFLFHMFVHTDSISYFHPPPSHSSYIVPMFYYLGFPYLAPWCFRCVVQSYKGANGITE